MTGQAHQPTGLLVSVRSAAEALVAMAGGADLIDVKEPSRGSLGAVDPEVLSEICDAVGGRLPISAALGELAESVDEANEYQRVAAEHDALVDSRRQVCGVGEAH